MHFRVRYLAQDFLDAHGLHRGTAGIRGVMPLLALAGVGLVAQHERMPYLALLGVVAGLFAAAHIFSRKRLETALRQSPATGEEVEFEFQEDTFAFRGRGLDIELGWSSVSGWAENARVVLLHLGPGQYYTLPWRAVPLEQREAVRAFLREHVPSGRAAENPAPARPPEPVLFTFAVQLTPAEVSTAYAVSRRLDPAPARFLLAWSLAAWAAAGAAVFSVLETPDPGRALDNGPMLILALSLALLPWMVRQQAWSAHVQMSRPGSERQVDVLDGGLHVRSSAGEATLTWASLLQWAAREGLVLVYASPDTFLTLPDRAMTPEQQTRLLALLRRNVRHLG